MRQRLTLILLMMAVPLASAQDAKPDAIKPAPSKVVAVTVYQNTALVTREVAVPDAMGLTEVVVSPLPPATVQSSLYAEGTDGLRILSARYRTRAIADDTREEVRKLEAKIKEVNRKVQQLQGEVKINEANAAFLIKLEAFTAATMSQLTEKGQLDSEKVIALANFIRETRTKSQKELLLLQQQIEDATAELQFTQRLMAEKSGGVVRTERDAVIVLDKTKPGGGTIKLNYLVQNARWYPQYKLRAGTKDKDPVQVEYLASMTQNTGEDWSGVAVTLSTAQPHLNAAPPDLRTLEVALGGNGLTSFQGQGGKGQAGQAPGIPAPPGTANLRDLTEQSKNLRSQAQLNYNNKEDAAGAKVANEAAALEQFRDLLVSKEDIGKVDIVADGMAGGSSVTYRIKDKITLPSRNDDQLLEIARLELAPKFYYKAVPILTPNVYRIADLTNTTDLVLLPGEATMYLGTDFVGQTRLPLVAIGKPFTVGFGVDPQIQATRQLIDKSRTIQGGNQILTFKYRTLISSYKTTPVEVQLWDRMPHAEAQQTIVVSLTKGDAELSKDPLYVRDEKPRNLLRWDLKVEPKQNGEKALSVEYEFKLELALNVNIGGFQSK